MKTRQRSPGPKGRTRGHQNALGVALTVIALGAILTGCIKNYDPRDDSSSIDTNPGHALAIATESSSA